jgi:hexosaminidase
MKKTGHFPVHTLAVGWLLLFHLPANGMPGENSLNILPIPENLTMRTGRMAIDKDFDVVIRCHNTTIIEEAVTRFLGRLQKRTGIPLASKVATNPEDAEFEIHCMGNEDKVQSIRTDESYALEITEERARLSASSPVGVLRGLETFLQLTDIDTQSFFVPSVKIEDHPRFNWRGLLIDVSRHFEPVEIIKRNLDAMAAVKMNVLHWHLSDDQGFRVESKVFPGLHQLGSDGKYYLQSEVHEIVAYAHNRGIRIVPEFDMPGHSTSWLVSYPELAAAPGPYNIERQWGVFEPCMDPSKEEVYRFLDAFIGEMAALFPDEYFHIGGDEVNPKQWNESSRIRKYKERNNLAENHELQVYFNQRLLGILAKHGKKMIGWDEILQPKLPESIIVQSWRGQASLARGARQGYRGILSYGYYLDHMRPASFHYAMDPLGNEAADLSDDEKTRILGGEACMWAEFVNPENIESRIWPRTAAIAERLWSPAATNDIESLYRRLEYIDGELISLGLRHRTLYHENIQRLAGTMDVRPLMVFAELLQPPSLGIRKRAQTYFSHTPLNRLVDVIIPESKSAREFSNLVDRRLSHSSQGPASEKIRESLRLWMANNAPLQPILDRSYLLKEVQPLAALVAELCKCGLEALNYLDSRQIPPQSWQEEAAALLTHAEEPHAEIYIAILPPIKKLVEQTTITLQ